MKNELNYGVGLYQEGIFYFTNPGLYKNKDGTKNWSALWNNKEYTFEGNTTVPLIIASETPENIQFIRRKFAFKYAQDVFHQSKKYAELVKKGGYIPATYNEDVEFLDTIQACLTPLPKSSAVVKELPRDTETNYKGSKALKSGQDLNKIFADQEIPELGKMI